MLFLGGDDLLNTDTVINVLTLRWIKKEKNEETKIKFEGGVGGGSH